MNGKNKTGQLTGNISCKAKKNIYSKNYYLNVTIELIAVKKIYTCMLYKKYRNFRLKDEKILIKQGECRYLMLNHKLIYIININSLKDINLILRKYINMKQYNKTKNSHIFKKRNNFKRNIQSRYIINL